MTDRKPDVLLIGHPTPAIVDGLAATLTVHRLAAAADRGAFLAERAERIRGCAIAYTGETVDGAFLARFPRLEMVSSLGVGYDHIDTAAAARRGIVVTNTPDVLTEEVADAALGLLLGTVREFPQAERYLRAGKWPERPYRLSPTTLRDRTVGLVGIGRIGRAIARRLDAFRVPVAYHARHPNPDLPYRYYADLIALARAVDTLVVVVPGGAATRNLIDAAVLAALGPNGILINIARGSVVDEPALIKALQDGVIHAAGLDVFADEPRVPAELIALDNAVLLPHVGSATVHTRGRMDQLVVDNLISWFAGKGPLTPVPETPWRRPA